MSTALVTIEDTPLFMGWATSTVALPYAKINPSMVKWIMACGCITIRNEPMTINRPNGQQIHVRVGDTVSLYL